MRILHLSDLHFGAETLHWGEVLPNLDKGLIGLANLKLNPSRVFPAQLRERVLQKAVELDWDLCVITGDLTNISAENEFQVAKKGLQRLREKGSLLLCAGNHDRYTTKSLGRMESFFKEDWPYSQRAKSPFPQYELGDWVIISLNQAVARGVFSSQGELQGGISALKELLSSLSSKKIILMGHYPLFLPKGVHEAKKHRLEGMKELAELLLEQKVRLYLHGHMHQSWSFLVEGSNLQAVNSGGCCRFEEGKKAGFHLIELGESASVSRIDL